MFVRELIVFNFETFYWILVNHTDQENMYLSLIYQLYAWGWSENELFTFFKRLANSRGLDRSTENNAPTVHWWGSQSWLGLILVIRCDGVMITGVRNTWYSVNTSIFRSSSDRADVHSQSRRKPTAIEQSGNPCLHAITFPSLVRRHVMQKLVLMEFFVASKDIHFWFKWRESFAMFFRVKARYIISLTINCCRLL